MNFDFRHPLGVKGLKISSFIVPSSLSLFLFASVFFSENWERAVF